MTQPRRLLVVFALLLALAGAGCALFESLGLSGGDSRVHFSHAIHGPKDDLECKDCHDLAAKEDRAGMPKMKKCMLCHEGGDENKPPERKLAALIGEKPVFSSVTKLPDEVTFSHQVHVTRGKLACTACHRGIETSEKITAEVRVEMDACVACHAERGVVATGGGDVVPPTSPTGVKAVPVPEETGAIALSWTKSMDNETKEEALVYLVYWSVTSPVPTTGAPAATVTGGTTCKLTGLPRDKDCYFRVVARDAAGNRSRLNSEGPAPASGRETDACAVCHKQIRKDQKPPSHQLAWTRLHGDTVRNAGSKIENRCRLCHTEASCSTCHREQAPANHTGFWRYRGHGVAVDMNRSSCAVCHRSDFCDRCHRETAPQSHTGSWGSTKNRHCLYCHLSSGLVRPCSLCHNHYVHNAPPIPGDPQHAGVPPTLCRSCHSIVQMQHADNGESCVLCHK